MPIWDSMPFCLLRSFEQFRTNKAKQRKQIMATEQGVRHIMGLMGIGQERQGAVLAEFDIFKVGTGAVFAVFSDIYSIGTTRSSTLLGECQNDFGQ
jgi:hypothetical protein